jgi:hypothetical protein
MLPISGTSGAPDAEAAAGAGAGVGMVEFTPCIPV